MVLFSDGPSIDLGSAADLYNWVVGDWDVKVFDYEAEGAKHESAGEWHFYWVLEGRAIQDVFIVPSRSLRSSTTPKDRNRYGSTVRYYDPDLKAWRITWFNPVRHVVSRLTARRAGNEIVQEGTDEDGSLMRWCFRDIKTDSFRWTGEQSTDGGKTWKLGAEFFAVRSRSSTR